MVSYIFSLEFSLYFKFTKHWWYITKIWTDMSFGLFRSMWCKTGGLTTASFWISRQLESNQAPRQLLTEMSAPSRCRNQTKAL